MFTKGKQLLNKRRIWIVAVALVAALALAGGITYAYLMAVSTPVVNTFKPAEVNLEVLESFQNNVKTDVNVKNTGTSSVYVRINLISYRVNEAGDHIGGQAPIPAFTAGTGWLRVGDTDTYIFAQPVAAGKSPAQKLISGEGIKLVEYDDADGGRQVVEVVADAIQSSPADAVKQAWNVNVSDAGVISLKE